jgi:pimeloyl-ACP methyl ester carboxylesterase
MTTHTFIGDDGVTLSYDIAGHGPAIVLLHGQSQYRNLWTRYGWLESLRDEYTVIAPDLRGVGDSSRVQTVAGHAFERYLWDLHEVLDHVGVNQAVICGWSFGAGVALRAAAQSSRLTAPIAFGARFGSIISPALAQTRLEDLERLEFASITGNWDGISPERQRQAHIIDFEGSRARILATYAWPKITPADVKLPALLVGGTEDTNSVTSLLENRPLIEAAGIRLEIFDRLNHLDLVENREATEPVVRRFLSEHTADVPSSRRWC